jgi:ribose transport system substrate-binding protein
MLADANELSRRAALSLLSCGVLACSKKQGAPARPRVSLIVKSLANEFFVTMQNGAREHQRSHAREYELLPSGTEDQYDAPKQVGLVERAIAQGVDAIVLAPIDSKALVPICKQALDAQIVVVNIDNKLDAQVLGEKSFSIPFIGPNNRKGARLAADRLAKALKPGDAVALIEGPVASYNSQQRKRGFEDAMRAAGMRIVGDRVANWETDQAERVTRELLHEHPELRAILAANDTMALGAASALQAAGKTEQVLLIGFDNTSAARRLLAERRMLATVDHHADRQAVFGIEYALEILSKNAIPADRETPVDLITI